MPDYYSQDGKTYAARLPWVYGPSTYQLKPRLSVRSSNITDIGPNVAKKVGRDLGAEVTVEYIVSYGLYQVFTEWYKTRINNGSSWFFIYLPSGAGFQWVTARFMDPPSGTALGGRGWNIRMHIELRERAQGTRPNLTAYGAVVGCYTEIFPNLTGWTVASGDGSAYTPELPTGYPYPDPAVTSAIHIVPEPGHGSSNFYKTITARDIKNIAISFFMPSINDFSPSRFRLFKTSVGAQLLFWPRLALADEAAQAARLGVGDAFNHPDQYFETDVTTSALLPNVWYQLRVSLKHGVGNSKASIRNLKTGELAGAVDLNGSYSTLSVDRVEFTAADQENTSPIYYTDIEVCA